MMIQRIAVVALVGLVGTGAQAVEFNKEALRAMQEEGHQIVEEAESVRRFKMRGELCLETAGNGLIIKACSDADGQKWRLDEEKHLVAHSKKCVAAANLRDCGTGNAKEQTWAHDDRKRLVNEAKQCLQVQGRAPVAGAKVVTAPCSDAATQVWQQAKFEE